MKTYLMVLASLLAGAFYTPKENATLHGRVYDENANPLIGATIRILNSNAGAVTDANGEYRLHLAPGTYDLEAQYTGYTTQKKSGVVVSANKDNVLNFTLASSGAALSEVVVMSVDSRSQRSGKASAAKPAGKSKLPASTGPASARKRQARPAGSAPPVAVGYVQPQILADQPANEAPVFLQKDEETFYDKKESARRDTTQPPSDYSAENYATIHENAFLEAQTNAVSTFSIDVDAAAYSNARRFLQAGQLPPADAVRIEEMVNYFDYQYPTPTGKDPFSVNTEFAECPWNPQHRLLLIGLQGRKIETGQLPPSNFVFLVDVSGSMNEPNKLPLVQESLALLTDQLRPQDRVALVVYAGAAGLVLPSTAGTDKVAIKAAIERLSAGGSTAGAAGIQLAYDVARKNLVSGGNNRVILCTDGDFNVGMSSDDELVKLIEKERESGVYLTVLGFGTGNYQDNKMQQLADKGNGNHAYIDQASEAKKVLISEFGGTLFAIAKDVKIQIEFNPARVAGYRLIGYENRLLAREDFDDDTKDAGELGAGHRVTALYEIVPAGQPLPLGVKNGEMRYQQTQLSAAATGSDELLTLKLRYKQPKVGAASSLIQTTVADQLSASPSPNFQLAASVAEFGLLLRNSTYKGNATYERALDLAKKAAKTDPGGYRKELCDLMERARLLAAPEVARK